MNENPEGAAAPLTPAPEAAAPAPAPAPAAEAPAPAPAPAPAASPTTAPLDAAPVAPATAPVAPKKKKTGLIVGLVLGFLAIVGVVVALLFVFVFNKGGDPVSEAFLRLINGDERYVSISSDAEYDFMGTTFEVNLNAQIDAKAKAGTAAAKIAGSYAGKGVLKAVWNVNSKIKDVLVGNSADQHIVDQMMLDLDGTENKSNLGANAILAVSLANAKANAMARRKPFYKYVAELAGTTDEMSIPMPMMNVMNGGEHASWATDFQEYMIIPRGAGNIADAVRMGAEVFHALKTVLKERGYPTTVGDEGGYAPYVRDGNNEPLECIRLAVEKTGYKFGDDIAIAMDIASSEFFDKDHYVLKTNGDWKSADDLINWYTWIIDNYPVISIEDGLAEDDWTNWKIMTDRIGNRCQLVGDDLFVFGTI